MRSPARGNKTMFFLTLWLIGVSLVAGVILLLLGMEDNLVLTLGITQVVGLLIPFLFYLLVTKQKHGQVLKWKPLGLKNAVLSVVITLAILPMVQLISYLSSFIFVPAITVIFVDITLYPIWLMLIIAAVFPALFEEFHFRGAIYSDYEAVPIRKIAIITGVFFGIIHLNFHQSIYAGAIGVLLAYVLYFTRSIWAPILIHFVNNALSVALSYSETYMAWANEMTESPLTYLLIISGASLVMLPVLIFCLKNLKPHTNPEEPESLTTPRAAQETEALEEPIIEEKPKVYTWAFWWTIVLFILFAGIMEIGLRAMY